MTWADVLPPGTGGSSQSSPLWLLLLMMRRDQRPRSRVIAVRLLQVFTKYSGCHPILKGPKPEGHHVTNHDESPNPRSSNSRKLGGTGCCVELDNRPPKGELGDSTHQNRPC